MMNRERQRMIKARGRNAMGESIVVLGLSGEDVTRLVSGLPISADLAELGVPVKVSIVYGQTEDDIVSDLRRQGLIR